MDFSYNHYSDLKFSGKEHNIGWQSRRGKNDGSRKYPEYCPLEIGQEYGGH